MRLTCPNCDAQYEVPDDVIPPEGRDVQCSNCGKTWFQAAAGAVEKDDFDLARHSARPEGAPPAAAPHPAAPAPEPVSEPEPEPAPEPDPEPPAPPPMAEPRPRQLDPEIASVLREEAERESRVRQAERGAVESQPDLGLDDMGRTDRGHDEEELRAQQSRDRMARLRGKDPDVPETKAKAAAAAAASGSRRELLPDIEEINSTLRSTDQPRKSEASEEIAAEPERKARSSFRRGFSWMLLLVAVAALVYAYSPQIAGLAPGAAPLLEDYVASVNQLRGWLDARVLAALQWLDSLSSEAAQQAG